MKRLVFSVFLMFVELFAMNEMPCDLSQYSYLQTRLQVNYDVMEESYKKAELHTYYRVAHHQMAVLDQLESVISSRPECQAFIEKNRDVLEKILDSLKEKEKPYIPRYVYEGEEESRYMRNIVRVISSKNGSNQFCNGVLVTSGDSAERLITASHCLGEQMFVLHQEGGKFKRVDITHILHNNTFADLAVLKLSHSLPAEKVELALQPPKAMAVNGRQMGGFLSSNSEYRIITAGYSMERGIGKFGQYIAYQRDCELSDVKPIPFPLLVISDQYFKTPPREIRNSCYAESGSSGAAVFALKDDKIYLVGIVSEAVYDGKSNFLHSSFSPYVYTLAQVLEDSGS